MPSLFEELKRRNVIRVAAAYIVLCWLLLQVADVVFDFMQVPDSAGRILIALLAIGFIPVLIFSWVYELTPEGLRKESEIEPGQSIATRTGRKLDYATIAMIVIGIGFVVFYDRGSESRPAGETPSAGFEGDRAASGSVPGESDVTAEKSIAALPFVNMSADPENEYFADGLSEELLNQLAQVPDLMVAGRTSSFSFKGRNEDLRAIGETLGVSNVLEGSVRRQSDQVRVTAQLVRVNDGFHLWSDTYDRTLDDVFAIQDDIARSVANALKIILDEEAWQAMQAVGVRNVEAFVAFQKGKELYARAHGSAPLLETLAKGMGFFEQAIELVPTFGAAYWTMADYYAHLMLEPGVSEEARAQALIDLRAVLDEAYEHSDDPVRRAFIDVDRVLFSEDWTPLRSRIEAALATEGCPDPTWIELAMAMGYAESMIPMWERYVRCEPLSITGPVERASAEIVTGDPEAGLALLQKGKEQFGAHPWLSGWQQRALMALGRHEEALAQAPEVIEDRNFYGWGAEALPLAAQGRIGEARAALANWEEEHGRAETIDVLVAFGDREAANELAADIDARPAGPFQLVVQSYVCLCGTPFDLDATPNLKARIAQAGIPWPPPEIIDYPAKDW